MTDEELSELLAHPRLGQLIDRRAASIALQTLAVIGGELSYVQAARLIGCPVGSIRGYRSRGILKGGNARCTITTESAVAFKAGYKPRRRN